MQYDFLRPEDRKFAPIVHVETTNVCNLKCIHCPHADIYKIIPDYKPQNMPMEMWRRIVDEVSQYPSALRLTPDGEPMMTNHWVDMVNYVYEKNVDTLTFNTNGMFLEGEKADVLLKPSSTKVVVEISLDGLFADTYAGIRIKGDYKRIMRNIYAFILERDRRKAHNVKVMVSIVKQPEVSDEEFRMFNRYWTPVVDKVIVRNYVDTKGLTPTKNIDERVIEDRWPCLVVFTRMVVTYDGKVRFCPDDWQKATTIGDLNKGDTLTQIWNSPVFQNLRRSHLEGKFEHPTCKTCTDWKVIRWGQDYTSALSSVYSGEKKSAEENMKYLWTNKQEA